MGRHFHQKVVLGNLAAALVGPGGGLYYLYSTREGESGLGDLVPFTEAAAMEQPAVQLC